ncbi:hypothetical protein N7462_005703 [Penicillium macrosclerotiorum]|uniref:uncharacterized protein n=1 Tax=Penicillium macrosclerotiorum TaxID=303699 RepID=UPI0025480521|nr:uncharacterized protein N7462_005703 [Penicillium macrosclerotiorum]KAJ5682538.1 hypothetical protein N7462_005703 [Penicillium macrosclerotiorum]
MPGVVSKLSHFTSCSPRATVRVGLQPVTYIASSSRVYSLPKDWKGTQPEESTIKRAKAGDATDPSAAATAAGMKEREVNEGVADDSKSQGTTERGGRKHGEKAKREHPKAPEPIIGMNDERGQKGN